MAGSTGLEPAASGLTVQCANQAAPRARKTPYDTLGTRPRLPPLPFLGLGDRRRDEMFRVLELEGLREIGKCPVAQGFLGDGEVGAARDHDDRDPRVDTLDVTQHLQP